MNFLLDDLIQKPVLTYHKFKDITCFEKQLHFIGNKFLLTIDDGDFTFYENACPKLSKKNIPTILFVIPSLIDTDTPFWWDEVVYYLGPKDGREKVRLLKTIPNTERLLFIDNLRSNSNKEPLRARQLKVSELLEMQDSGIVIANHSYTHPMFNQCTEEELRQEMRLSKKFFEEHGLKGYSIFAYPNGNHSELTERILKEEGIEYAFLFDHKVNQLPINPMRISRLSVNDYTPMWKFRFILSGWHSRLLSLRKKLYLL